MAEFDLKEAPPELVQALVRKTEAEANIAELLVKQEAQKEANLAASNDRNRVLVLSGPLLDTEQYIETLQRWSRRDPGKDITIHLNTPGGSVFDGNALVACIKQLRRSGHKVTIYGSGTVMSYGTVLLQAGDERILDKDTVVMIHALNAPMISGGLDTILDTTKMMEQVQERLLDSLAERATVSKTKLKNLTKRKELFLSAAEALKYGLCDRIE